MTEVVKQEFVTPDRVSKDESKNGSSLDMDEKGKAMQIATVTPAESTVTREEIAEKKDSMDSPLEGVTNNHVESPEDKKVRFDQRENVDSASDSPSSSGSQRGVVSRRGGRCSSPGRLAIPSPKNDAVLEFKAYQSPKRKNEPADSVPSLSSDTSPAKDSDTTHKGIKEVAGDSSALEKKEAGPLSSRADETRKTKAGEKKSIVTFSPVPPPRTPTRSPTGGRFQSLPVLDDDELRSPGSFFLSPQTPTASSRVMRGSGSFDKDDNSKEDDKQAARQPMRSPKTPRSPARSPRRDDRDRFPTTPTNFAMDYGKHPHSGSFDSSNVLAWLQSPTANGLFSPGGFSSMLNTPRAAPRTPRTPTVSTSFFFSDVAGLPGSDTSPKPGAESKKGGSRGVSSIICISPLASSKGKGATNSSLTPTINYRDMFLSPENPRGLPLLEDSPLKGIKSDALHSASRDPSIDAVHMAERDLMEDEDLSVLLQLASNTPKANGERPIAVSTSDGTHVFRSPQARKEGNNENLPSLQLPVIGDRVGSSNSTRLSRKTHSRDHGDTGDDFHRSLVMRSSAPTAAKSSSQPATTDATQHEKGKESSKADATKKPASTSGVHPPHPGYMQHHYGHPDQYYPHMPPGVPPHGGSMRVVVGGAPPARAKSSPPRSPHARAYPMGPGDPNYPPPPYAHYPHHHGVPPPHMHHYYPPVHHHPPPRHMPMYGAQHPPSKSNPPKKPVKLNPITKAAKRPLPQEIPAKPGSAKKQKKPPSSGTKKKNRSPPLTDKVERQKAAANIQAVNQASGGKNDKAAALAAAILRGVTMRPSGKWQAQLYFAGKSRYIGVFDTREKAALAYEIAREKLKTEKQSAEGGQLSAKATEAAVNAARKAAFEGVNERDPRV